MRNSLLVLVLTFIFFNAKADFVQYFVIKHNTRIIPWAYENSPVYNLSVKNIKAGDSLSVEFHDDTPCDNCVSIIYAMPVRKDSTGLKPTIFGFGINNHRAVIDLNSFRLYRKEDTLFDLYYYEQGGINSNTKPQKISRIKMWGCNEETIEIAPKFHIEVNESLIPYEKDTFPIAYIKVSEIKENDSLTIINNACTSCKNCQQIAYAVPQKYKGAEDRAIVRGVGTNKEYGGGIKTRDKDWGNSPKISLKAFKNVQEKIKVFDVYYYEVGETQNKKHQLVMRIYLNP